MDACGLHWHSCQAGQCLHTKKRQSIHASTAGVVQLAVDRHAALGRQSHLTSWLDTQQKVWRRGVHSTCAAQSSNDGIGAKVGRFARQLQGALPLVGIISRLASPSGGIASDKLAYPEFCRMVLDKPPDGFNDSLQQWGQRHGPPGSRRLVMLFLWMARVGGGVVPRQKVMSAAKRVRVTQDVEIEVERFEGACREVEEKYEYVATPDPGAQDVVDMAVDALCLLSLGIKESEEIPPAEASALEKIVQACFIGKADLAMPGTGILQMVESAVSGRQGRATATAR